MESEKVKEIKKALKNCQKNNCLDCLYFIDEKMCRANDLLFDTITLINELESENERLMKLQARGGCRVAELGIENQQLKDRIADLEKVYDRQVRIINDLHIEVVKEQEKLPKFAERLKEKIQKCSGCYIPNCFESPTDEFAYSEIEVNKAIDETLKEMLGE